MIIFLSHYRSTFSFLHSRWWHGATARAVAAKAHLSKQFLLDFLLSLLAC